MRLSCNIQSIFDSAKSFFDLNISLEILAEIFNETKKLSYLWPKDAKYRGCIGYLYKYLNL